MRAYVSYTDQGEHCLVTVAFPLSGTLLYAEQIAGLTALNAFCVFEKVRSSIAEWGTGPNGCDVDLQVDMPSHEMERELPVFCTQLEARLQNHYGTNVTVVYQGMNDAES